MDKVWRDLAWKPGTIIRHLSLHTHAKMQLRKMILLSCYVVPRGRKCDQFLSKKNPKKTPQKKINFQIPQLGRGTEKKRGPCLALVLEILLRQQLMETGEKPRCHWYPPHRTPPCLGQAGGHGSDVLSRNWYGAHDSWASWHRGVLARRWKSWGLTGEVVDR